MCGILGLISKIPTQIEFEKSLHIIQHRGPDDFGKYNFEDRLYLGMRRLSIIDIHHGAQPIFNEKKDLVIVFNGEIYNYLKLKKNLELNGVIFQTNSDTEVILKGYEMYGESFFRELKGMFAIAIHDKLKNKIVLVRDRTGEKPLYYSLNNNFISFGSELKSIIDLHQSIGFNKKEINQEALALYFQLTYIPAPYSIYKGISKLEPGKVMQIDTETFEVKEEYFWDICKLKKSNLITDFNLAKETLRKNLFETIEDQMISEVPLGAFLSGGVDSSIVCAVMSSISSKRINTFSIGFENPNYDESDKSNLVAQHLKTNHFNYTLSLNEIKQDLENIILNFDEPFADSSSLPTYFVSKKTKKEVTVALTGDGGDELFGGYNRYFMPLIGNMYRKYIPSFIHNNSIKPLSKLIKQKTDARGSLFKLQKLISGIGNNEEEDIKNIISLGFNSHEIKNLLIAQGDETNSFFESVFNRAIDHSGLSKSRIIDYQTSLEGDMLVKVDRTSMLNSLECRSPFLDHQLIEFSFSLPEDFLIHKNETKYILKKTFEDLLPKNLFKHTKSGFGVPVGDWLRSDLKFQLQSFINKEFIEEQKIFNYNYVKKMVNDHLNQHCDQTFKVWSFYCFQLWYCKKFTHETEAD